ncbi:hypothetical protein ACRALDRAFT_1072748 [Sodiomyces alcalophilus JCM 7366]|uniref:uncharacterized protein n=1 Tax=Sodiomyces alcalophilus JCM 7366 TaxID=591952 RepID=UPI0039B52ABC
MTRNTTVNPNPDFFDGAHPDAVDQEVREALDKIIIPTAPNLFLEAKSSAGTFDVELQLSSGRTRAVTNLSTSEAAKPPATATPVGDYTTVSDKDFVLLRRGNKTCPNRTKGGSERMFAVSLSAGSNEPDSRWESSRPRRHDNGRVAIAKLFRRCGGQYVAPISIPGYTTRHTWSFPMR